MTLSYVKRVQAGAALLDQVYPLWFDSVDLDELDMSSEYKCILAQLYGSYYNGQEKLEEAGLEPDEHGFDVTCDEDADKAYYWLDKRWRQEIERRRAA